MASNFIVNSHSLRVFFCRVNLRRHGIYFPRTLSLYSDKMIFKHSKNASGDHLIILIKDIASIDLCWVKLFGFIPVAPCALEAHTRTGEKIHFVVFNRKILFNEIKKLLTQ
jgi:hypothetical protein